MNSGDHVILFLYVLFIFIVMSCFALILEHKQYKIIAQNDYITEVLLCNPIDLTKPIGTDLIRDPNPRKVKK